MGRHAVYYISAAEAWRRGDIVQLSGNAAVSIVKAADELACAGLPGNEALKIDNSMNDTAAVFGVKD